MLVQVADAVIVVMMHNKQTQLSMVLPHRHQYHTFESASQAGPQAYGYVQVQDQYLMEQMSPIVCSSLWWKEDVPVWHP